MTEKNPKRTVEFLPPEVKGFETFLTRDHYQKALRTAREEGKRGFKSGYKKGYEAGKSESLKRLNLHGAKSQKLLTNRFNAAVQEGVRTILRSKKRDQETLNQELLTPLIDRLSSELSSITIHPSRRLAIEGILRATSTTLLIEEDSSLDPAKTILIVPHGEIIADSSEYLEQLLAALPRAASI